jgi:hypothetical protein
MMRCSIRPRAVEHKCTVGSYKSSRLPWNPPEVVRLRPRLAQLSTKATESLPQALKADYSLYYAKPYSSF